MDVDLAEALERIEHEQRELRSLLEQVLDRPGSKKRQRPSRGRCDEAADLAHLRILLPAIWRAIEAAPFTVAELLDLGASRTDLGAAMGSVGLAGRQLGKLLARGVDKPVDYLCVRRCSEEAAGVIWALESRVSANPRNPSNQSAPLREAKP